MTELPRLIDSNLRLHPLSLSISETLTPVSTASMQLPKEENLPARAFVELFTPLGSAGIYRVRSPEDAYGNDITSAELEHAIAEVGDYLVKTEISEMMSAGTAMQTIFSYYGGSRWQLGSTSALSGTIAVEAKYDRVLDVMLEILRQTDSIMGFDFSTTPWTINFATKSTTVTAEGRLGRNVRSARVIYDDTELCTRVWYQIPSTDSSGQPTMVWTHIDAGTLSTYGVVERTLSSASDYTASEASAVATEYLNSHKSPRITVEIDVEELSRITGESLDTFTLGKRFRLAIPEYSVIVEDYITAISWADVCNAPDQASVRLGDEEDTVITFLHDVDAKGGSGGGGGAGKNIEELFKEYRTRFEMDDYHIALVSEHADHANNILQAAGIDIDSQTGVVIYHDDIENSVGARLTVNAENISAEVVRATEAEGTLSGRLSVTESAITAEVTRAQGAESTLSGQLTVEAGKITQIVTNIGADGTVTAASIVTKINESTGQGEIHLDADHVYINAGASSESNVVTVIGGKTTLNEVDANLLNATYLDAKIASIPTLHGIAASFTGNIHTTSALMGYQIYSGTTGSGFVNISDPVNAVQVVPGTTEGTYKLQYKKCSDSSWQDGGTFNRATSETIKVSGSWSGGTWMVSADENGQRLPISVTVDVNATADGSYNEYFKVHAATQASQSGSYINHVSKQGELTLTGSGSSAKINAMIDNIKVAEYSVGDVYMAGWNAVTVSSVAVYGSPAATATSISVQATASNGATKMEGISITTQRNNAYNSGYADAHLSASWSNNVWTVSKSTSGNTNSLTCTVQAGISYNSSTHKYTATAYGNQVSRATAESGTQAYDAGVSAGNTAGYNSAHLSGSWSGTKLTVSKVNTGTLNSLSYVVSAAASISYNTSTHKYTASASAKVDGTQRATGSAVSGTEAYDAGYSAGYKAGWNGYRITLIDSSHSRGYTHLYYGSWYGTLYVAPTGGANPVYNCVGQATGFDIPAART